jgi:hypothetical protein
MTLRHVVHMVACFTALYGFSANGATVFPSAGDVFINQGKGFQKINGATMVRVGDSVMVSPDGFAQVKLDDGNVITVSPGAVLSVPSKARAQDAGLPDGAHATQGADAGGGAFGLLAAAALGAGGLAGAAAVAASGDAPPTIPPTALGAGGAAGGLTGAALAAERAARLGIPAVAPASP